MNKFFRISAIVFTVLTAVLCVYAEYFLIKKDPIDPFVNNIYMVGLLMALTGTLFVYYSMLFVNHKTIKSTILPLAFIFYTVFLVIMIRNTIFPSFHFPFE